MDATLIAALPAYTAVMLWLARQRWAHRCAECSYRRRVRTGRHRPDRVAANRRPAPAPHRPRPVTARPPVDLGHAATVPTPRPQPTPRRHPANST